MGTRATATIYDNNPFDGEVGTPLVKLYTQYDGYPDGLGVRLAELANKRIVNGIGMRDTISSAANGMGCLAAQIIAEMKEDIGNVYVTTLDAGGEEYNYDLWYENGSVHIKCEEVEFSGPVTKFIEKINSGELLDEEDEFDPL